MKSIVTEHDKLVLIGFDDLALYRMYGTLNVWGWPKIFKDEESEGNYKKGRRRSLMEHLETLVGGAEKMNRLGNTHMTDDEHHEFYNKPIPEDATRLLKKMRKKQKITVIKEKVKSLFMWH